VAVSFLVCFYLLSTLSAQAQPAATSRLKPSSTERTRYLIDLKLDFDARTYTGLQRLHWVNREGGSTSVVYFHLYPNLRTAPEPAREKSPVPLEATTDEPRLEVVEVRAGSSGSPLQFGLEDSGLTLRVQLREAVPENRSAEIEIAFKGSVPEIDADETSLSAHVVQQVGAAMRSTREVRRPRDTNFFSRGVMLLGSFHPLLASRIAGEWRRKAEATIGDAVFTDVADYEVSIETDDKVAIFASADALADRMKPSREKHHFAGESLRGFSLVAGRSLRSAETTVAGVKVRSLFTADHEKVGRRVLTIAADAARVFTERFGPLPVKTISVTEAPLVAGLGSTEFAGLAVIASAFYVDFDSPQMRNLPEIVREQRASVEDSLEFAVAHGVAHEWWGRAVGGDPERLPVLDEGLAHWSALLYYQDVRGPERAKEAEEEQLRGVYQIYRTFGGEDMPAASPSREFQNSFQYAAIVIAKGALMFSSLRQLLGDERFFKSLRLYYELNKLKVANLESLREELFEAVEVNQRRILARTLSRWLYERHGDEDVAPPDPGLAAALGITVEQQATRDRNAFARLGRFFWRQMTRIR
jgi:hypothetical protein